jgi:hypothetical protein
MKTDGFNYKVTSENTSWLRVDSTDLFFLPIIEDRWTVHRIAASQTGDTETTK